MLGRVPFFMDRHEFSGLTALDAANMHLKDLALQGKFGVQLLTYWFDYDRDGQPSPFRPRLSARRAVDAGIHCGSTTSSMRVTSQPGPLLRASPPSVAELDDRCRIRGDLRRRISLGAGVLYVRAE